MFRFLLRFLGVLLLSAAFVAIVIDGTRSIAASDLVLTPLGQTVTEFGGRPSLNMMQAGVQRRVAPWLWDPVLVFVLQQPTFLVLGLLGILFMVLGRRRTRRRVGVLT